MAKKEKNKYDILSKKVKKEFKGVLPSLVKMLFVARKIETNRISDEKIEYELSKAISKALPAIKTTTHLGYETAKDVSNLDKETLARYIEESGLTLSEFSENYHENVNGIVKLLLAFAVFDKENINFPSLKDPKTAIELISGESYLDIFSNDFDSMSEESEEMIERAFDKELSYKDLTEEEIRLMEEYHNRYMNEYIYPSVGMEETPEEKMKEIVKALFLFI